MKTIIILIMLALLIVPVAAMRPSEDYSSTVIQTPTMTINTVVTTTPIFTGLNEVNIPMVNDSIVNDTSNGHAMPPMPPEIPDTIPMV